MTDDPSQDTYPNQGRASGYTDGSGNDVGENIINRVTELMIGPQTKMIELSMRLDDSYKTQERRFDYMLGQMAAFLEKEDARHDLLTQNEVTTEAALASVALRLDQIVGYVQQGIATGVKALAVAEKGVSIGEEALAVGQKALGVSESNAKRLAHVEKRFVEVESTVKALKQGQVLSERQIKQFLADLADLRKEIAALREAAKEAARLAEMHQLLSVRAEEHEKRLAEIEAWRESFERASGG